MIIFFMALTPLTKDYVACYNGRYLTAKLFIVLSGATGGAKNVSERPPAA
jgi:hypothetical protein